MKRNCAMVAQADVVLDYGDNFATLCVNRVCLGRKPCLGSNQFDRRVSVFDFRHADNRADAFEQTVRPATACLFREDSRRIALRVRNIRPLSASSAAAGETPAADGIERGHSGKLLTSMRWTCTSCALLVKPPAACGTLPEERYHMER
jgi:hypothetical protein